MEAQQVSEAESAREQLRDLQDQIAGQKASKQELEAELERQKQVKILDGRLPRKALCWRSREATRLEKDLTDILVGWVWSGDGKCDLLGPSCLVTTHPFTVYLTDEK